MSFPHGPKSFVGAPARYTILRQLGAGGFGVVYEAFDEERRIPVALKHLSALSADALYRFKREFRTLSDLSHPNLVQLYDLLENEGRWFFTMELIDGRPLQKALRPEGGVPAVRASDERSGITPKRASSLPPPTSYGTDGQTARSPVDRELLGRVFRQLAEGVDALHRSGKLHRDLKCSNVLVTPEDRAVLLDFGLVSEVDTDPAGLETKVGDIVGTPLYMSPEQCAGTEVGTPTDWYAFGVMLFRALTGTFPFEGRVVEVFKRKQFEDAKLASEVVPELPPELVALTAELLVRAPAMRAGIERVREVLGPNESVGVSASLAPRTAGTFVGREEELAVLERAFDEAREGKPVTTLVHGVSGVGKSALVRHFVRGCLRRRRTAVVLEGRCYSQETLPYKALDGVVDSLARYLLKVSKEESSTLVPRHVGDLVQLFPVLRRVPTFAEASNYVVAIPDVQERRRRAFEALRELLGRIADRRPLVIFVDDLQWGDAASAAVLKQILAPPDSPAFLLVGVYRSTEAETSAFLRELTAEDGLRAPLHRLEVKELDEGAAVDLARELLGGNDDLAREVSREARGNPLFIDLLSRHAELRAGETSSLSLAHALERSVADLEVDGRRLLELLSVGGRPLEHDVLASALGLETLSPSLVGTLRTLRLLRSRITEGQKTEIECYHDRIRETVVAGLSDSGRRGHHHALAEALERSESNDHESMAIHFRAADRPDRAFWHAVKAADRAVESLAFARGAGLYRMALDLSSGTAEERGRIEVALGDAYMNAGLGADAAQAYLEAAQRADAHAALDLRHRAAQQFLFSGHLDEGRAILSDVLRAVGLRMPKNPALALASFVGRRTQVRFRGLHFEERDPTTISAADALKIDVCWSVAIGLSMIDPIRAGSFQAQHLLLALESGDITRITKAVAVEVTFAATAGMKNRARTEELERKSRDLIGRVDDPFVHALTTSCFGGAAWLEGRWRAAMEWQKKADETLRRECTGAAWQLATINIVMCDALFRLGEWGELFDRYQSMVADARARGDLFLEIYLRIKFGALGHLAENDADGAERELHAAVERWTKGQFNLLHFWELYQATECDLYRGAPDRAFERLEANASDVRKSALLTLQLYRVSMLDLRGRVALAMADSEKGRARKRYLDEARRSVKKLAAEETPWADALSLLVDAGLAAADGRSGQALVRLREAEHAAERADMFIHAAAARMRRGELTGGTSGNESRARATADLKERRIALPARFTEVLAPGFAR